MMFEKRGSDFYLVDHKKLIKENYDFHDIQFREKFEPKLKLTGLSKDRPILYEKV